MQSHRSGGARPFAWHRRIVPCVLAGVIAVSASACSGSSSSGKYGKYGTLPSFLPKSSIHPDSVLTGTAARPALTSEGDAVRVVLPHGSVLATMSGPAVPGEGLPQQNVSTTCTWTVVLSDAKGTVPVRMADFTAVDHLGGLSHPYVLAGTPAPPAVLKPGHAATFKIRTVMRTGEGVVRWAPGSPRILSSWDFTVEID